ncbi:MAG: hypothetical protein ACYCWE_14650 [Eubacteriales bacterium]
MKIKIILFVISMLFIVFTVSCNEKDNWIPKGMKKVSTDAVDYTMYVPDSWTVDISTGVISAYVKSTDRSNITMVAFNLENEDADMTADDYWAKYESELRQTFPDMEYTSIQEDGETTVTAETTTESETTSADAYIPTTTLLDGFSANKYIYTATVTGVTYKYMQVICIRGGIAYLFTYTTVPENFDIHLEEVDRILENFSFNK